MGRLATLLVVVFLGASASSFAATTGGPPAMKSGVPSGAVVRLEADRTDWLLGEDLFLLFIVENRGTEPLEVWFGSDNRGTTRPTRFTVTAIREDGVIAHDPRPDQTSMGGPSWEMTLEPGEEKVLRIRLADCRVIREPGSWTVTIHHDLGWKAAPSASVRLRFRPPLPFEARMLVDTALSPASAAWDWWGWGQGDKRTPPPPTLGGIFHPAYLPALRDAARRGEVRAIPALGRIDTPEATRLLADLTGSRHPGVADAAAEELIRRDPVTWGSAGTGVR